MTDNYPIVISWSDEDEAYIADMPDLHACSPQAEPPEEALREILIARAAWLEMAHEKGFSLPNPSESPYLPKISRKGTPAAAVAA